MKRLVVLAATVLLTGALLAAGMPAWAQESPLSPKPTDKRINKRVTTPYQRNKAIRKDNRITKPGFETKGLAEKESKESVEAGTPGAERRAPAGADRTKRRVSDSENVETPSTSAEGESPTGLKNVTVEGSIEARGNYWRGPRNVPRSESGPTSPPQSRP